MEEGGMSESEFEKSERVARRGQPVSLDLPAIQQNVARFVDEQGLATSVPTRVLDLAAEAGEVAKEALKGSSYDRAPFQPTGHWASELGDCFFSLVCLANSTGVDLERALADVLDTYRRRLAQSGDAGSGR
jgi:NTP pyrophosphatase (non-canonical NTP hydrolase)